MAKKDINEKQRVKMAKPSSGGGKKGVAKKSKSVTKDGLVGQIRTHKKGIQEARFGLSQEAQQKGGSRKQMRKQIARAATRLTLLRKQGVVRG